MRITHFILGVAAVVSANVAQAECALPNWFLDGLGREPLSIGERCEFENAGSWKSPLEGGPLIGFAGSLVAQRITDLTCGATQVLWVADCETGEALVFFGQLCGGPDITVPNSTVSCFDGPDGLLEMSQSSSLSQLREAARRNDIRTKSEHISDRLNGLPFNRRPSPNCGCKLYYPDSPGAKL